jgi:choline transport protein
MGATSSYATAQQIEALIAPHHPTYTIQGWHGALLSIGITAFCLFFNTGTLGYGSSLRPQSCIHWVSGNVGLSCLVGLLGLVVTLIGSDSACHLSEELKDTAWVKWANNCDSPGKL